MSVIDFPPQPQPLGTIHAGSGINWRWDGTKWVAASTISALITVTVDQILPPGFSGTVFVEAAAPLTVNLPTAPQAGQLVTVKDGLGNAATYAITVAGNGRNIEGAATKIIRTNYGWMPLVYSGDQWVQT